VFSIAVGISVADISGRAIANLGYNEVKHLGPVFAGDTIYASSKIIGKRESATKPDRGIVSVETKAFNQKEEAVLSFHREVMIPKRPLDQR
jgi:acyl dehydratase